MRLAFEAEAIGFHLTAHPLDAYATTLRRLGVVPSNQLEQRAQTGAARVRIAGTVVGAKERITRSGSRMAWVRLSDSGGIVRGNGLQRGPGARARGAGAGRSVLVTADIRMEGEALRVTAQDVSSLDQAAPQTGRRHARLAATAPRRWRTSTRCCSARARGRGRVVLIPRLGGAGRGDRAARRLQRLAAACAGDEGAAGR